jgi:hypothetical protein
MISIDAIKVKPKIHPMVLQQNQGRKDLIIMPPTRNMVRKVSPLSSLGMELNNAFTFKSPNTLPRATTVVLNRLPSSETSH